jgi:hypothetical protein
LLHNLSAFHNDVSYDPHGTSSTIYHLYRYDQLGIVLELGQLYSVFPTVQHQLY